MLKAYRLGSNDKVIIATNITEAANIALATDQAEVEIEVQDDKSEREESLRLSLDYLGDVVGQ